MAELELTPIENGMPDGGTAVGKNFTDIVSALQPLIDAEALKGKVLWSGSNVMGAGQTITLSMDPSECPTGVELCWWAASGNNDRNTKLVTKAFLANNQNVNIASHIRTGTGGHATQKTVAFNGKVITGSANNALTTDAAGHPADFVLYQVLAV